MRERTGRRRMGRRQMLPKRSVHCRFEGTFHFLVALGRRRFFRQIPRFDVPGAIEHSRLSQLSASVSFTAHFFHVCRYDEESEGLCCVPYMARVASR